MNVVKVISIICLFISCAKTKNDRLSKVFELHSGTIDYCEEYYRLKKYRTVTDSTPEDSSIAYAIAMANCLRNKIIQHNKDSLTNDSCLCRKRLEKILEVGYDSAIISFHKNHSSMIVVVRPRDPNILDGIQEYESNDSCRLIGFENR